MNVDAVVKRQSNQAPRDRCRRRYRKSTGDLFDPDADKAGMVFFPSIEVENKEVETMHVTLGRTGIRVKKLGFGGIPIQRVEETQAIDVVRYAVERGMDFIDTSRIYTTSEERIGRALKQTDKKVVLASKSKERTADAIRKDVEISREKLQRDFIDLYQCHFVQEDEYSRIISPGGALEGLQRAKEEGKIGSIGITSHSLQLLDKIIDDGLFDTIMVCFSFLEPDARDKVIPKAISKNIGVIAMKPLSGGVIDQPKPALKFAFSQEGVLVLCGIESRELFDEDWAVYQGSRAFDEEDERIIEEIRKEHDRKFCHRCDYCQPCTEGINIQAILGIKSHVKRVGEDVLANPLRRAEIETARNCTECGQCMTRCPYDLPIPDLIRENLRFVDDILARM
jgi:predicted aldo/keto reductase-like oxidoreductase